MDRDLETEPVPEQPPPPSAPPYNPQRPMNYGTPLTSQTWVPVPDPTVLTAGLVDEAKDQLRRELNFQREAVLMLIRSTREVFETRLDGMDKAINLLQTIQDRIPARMTDMIDNLKRLTDQRFSTQEEQFHSIQLLFQEKDARAEQVSNSAKEAVTTALQAAKEAVAAALQAAKELVAVQNAASTNAILKSETATDKRLEETARLIATTTNALDARISAIAESSKNTMTRQEVEQLFRTVMDKGEQQFKTMMDKMDGPTGLAMRLEGVIAQRRGTIEEGGRNTQQNQWVIGALLGGAAILISLIHYLK
jgi:hypothetical protein